MDEYTVQLVTMKSKDFYSRNTLSDLAALKSRPSSRLNLASCPQSGHSGGALDRPSAGCGGRGRGTAAPGDPAMDLPCCLLIRPGDGGREGRYVSR